MRRERGPYRYRRLRVLEGYGGIRCPRCGAVFHKGRWSWRAAPPGAKKQRCPACRRIEERFPGGYVQLSGDFFAARRDEVLARVRWQRASASRTPPRSRASRSPPTA